MASKKKPFVLIVLDGFGYRKASSFNAIATAKTPNWSNFWKNHPHALLNCSGKSIGLPKNQMGNSEIGHMHIGAGRILEQTLTKINHTLTKSFLQKNNTIKKIFSDPHPLHIIGLLSAGGVHSHEEHIFTLIKFAKQFKKQIYIHALLDGRDTPPKSAKKSILKLENLIKNYKFCKIASICGRYYAMDRDNRWDRVKKAYDTLTSKTLSTAPNTLEALKLAYARGENDEFVKPTHCTLDPITINNGDNIIFMNFRADRARQLTMALTSKKFTFFKRSRIPKINNFVTLTKYHKDFNFPVLFPTENISNTLGEIISKRHKNQLRIAETEKYAHVTYFFNCGKEKPWPNEDRILIPSAHVKTYDLKPEMRALKITQKLLSLMSRYSFIVCNFANPDMVGHTGNFKATCSAIETIDYCLGKIIYAAKQLDGEVIITADHGNAELMYNFKFKQPYTAHTINPVPLVYIGKPVKNTIKKGSIIDIAPTILYLLGYKIPREMSGKILFHKI